MIDNHHGGIVLCKNNSNTISLNFRNTKTLVISTFFSHFGTRFVSVFIMLTLTKGRGTFSNKYKRNPHFRLREYSISIMCILRHLLIMLCICMYLDKVKVGRYVQSKVKYHYFLVFR